MFSLITFLNGEQTVLSSRNVKIKDENVCSAKFKGAWYAATLVMKGDKAYLLDYKNKYSESSITQLSSSMQQVPTREKLDIPNLKVNSEVHTTPGGTIANICVESAPVESVDSTLSIVSTPIASLLSKNNCNNLRSISPANNSKSIYPANNSSLAKTPRSPLANMLCVESAPVESPNYLNNYQNSRSISPANNSRSISPADNSCLAKTPGSPLAKMLCVGSAPVESPNSTLSIVSTPKASFLSKNTCNNLRSISQANNSRSISPTNNSRLAKTPGSPPANMLCVGSAPVESPNSTLSIVSTPKASFLSKNTCNNLRSNSQANNSRSISPTSNSSLAKTPGSPPANMLCVGSAPVESPNSTLSIVSTPKASFLSKNTCNNLRSISQANNSRSISPTNNSSLAKTPGSPPANMLCVESAPVESPNYLNNYQNSRSISPANNSRSISPADNSSLAKTPGSPLAKMLCVGSAPVESPNSTLSIVSTPKASFLSKNTCNNLRSISQANNSRSISPTNNSSLAKTPGSPPANMLCVESAPVESPNYLNNYQNSRSISPANNSRSISPADNSSLAKTPGSPLAKMLCVGSAPVESPNSTLSIVSTPKASFLSKNTCNNLRSISQANNSRSISPADNSCLAKTPGSPLAKMLCVGSAPVESPNSTLSIVSTPKASFLSKNTCNNLRSISQANNSRSISPTNNSRLAKTPGSPPANMLCVGSAPVESPNSTLSIVSTPKASFLSKNTCNNLRSISQANNSRSISPTSNSSLAKTPGSPPANMLCVGSAPVESPNSTLSIVSTPKASFLSKNTCNNLRSISQANNSRSISPTNNSSLAKTPGSPPANMLCVESAPVESPNYLNNYQNSRSISPANNSRSISPADNSSLAKTPGSPLAKMLCVGSAPVESPNSTLSIVSTPKASFLSKNTCNNLRSISQANNSRSISPTNNSRLAKTPGSPPANMLCVGSAPVESPNSTLSIVSTPKASFLSKNTCNNLRSISQANNSRSISPTSNSSLAKTPGSPPANMLCVGSAPVESPNSTLSIVSTPKASLHSKNTFNYLRSISPANNSSLAKTPSDYSLISCDSPNSALTILSTPKESPQLFSTATDKEKHQTCLNSFFFKNSRQNSRSISPENLSLASSPCESYVIYVESIDSSNSALSILTTPHESPQLFSTAPDKENSQACLPSFLSKNARNNSRSISPANNSRLAKTPSESSVISFDPIYSPKSALSILSSPTESPKRFSTAPDKENNQACLPSFLSKNVRNNSRSISPANHSRLAKTPSESSVISFDPIYSPKSALSILSSPTESPKRFSTTPDKEKHQTCLTSLLSKNSKSISSKNNSSFAKTPTAPAEIYLESAPVDSPSSNSSSLFTPDVALSKMSSPSTRKHKNNLKSTPTIYHTLSSNNSTSISPFFKKPHVCSSSREIGHFANSVSTLNSTYNSSISKSCNNTTSDYFPDSMIDTTNENPNSTKIVSETQNQSFEIIQHPLKLSEVMIPHTCKSTKKHFCIFCKTLQTKLSRHMSLKHKSEKEIKKILKLPFNSKERMETMEELRKKGDFLHNTSEEYNTGILIVSRQQRFTQNNNADDYVCCKNCKAFFSKRTLRIHLRKCGVYKFNSRDNLISARQITQYIHKEANPTLRGKIFPVLRNDAVTQAIRYDELVIKYGNKLSENYALGHQHDMIRSQLRLLGRYMIQIKELDKGIKEFKDIFKPELFDTCIKALRKVSKWDEEVMWFRTPAVAVNLVSLVKKCGRKQRAEFIKINAEDPRKDLDNFLLLWEEEAPVLISKKAFEDQCNQRRIKKVVLPSKNDIKKLYLFLKDKMSKAIAVLDKEFDEHFWKQLVTTTLIFIQIFNRRRAGEIERLKISNYSNKEVITENCEKDIIENMSAESITFAKQFVRLTLRGKLGRTVSVLLSPLCIKSIDLVLKYRSNAGINKKNEYIFAKKNTSNFSKPYYRACPLLKQYSSECGAEIPESLRGTALRKHIATYTSMLNIEEASVDQLANFMGHHKDIHKNIYRMSIPVAEITRVSKLLMAAIGDDDGEDDDENVEVISNQDDADPQNVEVLSNQDDADPGGNQNSSTSSKRKTRSTSPYGKTKRKKWTHEEREAIRSTFGNLKDLKKLPSGIECLKAVNNNEALKNRTPMQVKAWIDNQRRYKLKI